MIMAAGLSLAVVGPAGANDSAAAIGSGGLTLVRSEAIRPDRQALLLSREQVRASPVFANTASRGIETLVAFPLPDAVHSPAVEPGAILRTGSRDSPRQFQLQLRSCSAWVLR